MYFFKQETAYEISACLVGSGMCIRDSYQGGDACIGDLMCSEVDVLPLETTLFEAARTLTKYKRRRMPVVDDGRFVGQISCRSILQAFKDSMLAHDNKED